MNAFLYIKKVGCTEQKIQMPVIRLLRIVKGFVIFFTVHVAFFVSSSDGLKCYECSDDYSFYLSANVYLSANCSAAQVYECKEFSDFCGTAISANNQSSSTNCGKRDKCVVKGCAHENFCAKPPIETAGLSFNMTCCKGDLCNSFSSARLYETNLFSCIKLFSLVLLLCKVL